MAIIHNFQIEAAAIAFRKDIFEKPVQAPVSPIPAISAEWVTRKHNRPKALSDSAHPAYPVLFQLEEALGLLRRTRRQAIPWSFAAALLYSQTGIEYLDMATASELNNVLNAVIAVINSRRSSRNRNNPSTI